MKISSTILLSKLLLISTISAIPNLLHRALSPRSAKPIPPGLPVSSDTVRRDSQLDSGWSGALLQPLTDGTLYTSVTAMTTVPAFAPPPGGSPSDNYLLAVWVGIDGHLCSTNFFQTGWYITMNASQTQYRALFAWYPKGPVVIDLSISPGHVVKMTVEATSATTGTATVENLSNGQSHSVPYSEPSLALCQTSAEWIIETSGGDNSLPNFGSITFTDASAGTTGGSIYGPNGGKQLNLLKAGHVYTNVENVTPRSFDITHI